MKLSVSNIAWEYSNKDQALEILKKYNIKYIDIAPTLLTENKNINDINSKNIKNYYNNFNIKIVGMQSLLYPFPDISLFDGEYNKNLLLNYLDDIFLLAKKLNIKNLIFGSPKNRLIKNIDSYSIENSLLIFKEISERAKKYSCIICLEANPKEYGCNFITNTTEAIDFIKKINSNNFKLNLDISTVILNKENIENIFKNNLNIIQHVHISSPYIKDIINLDNEFISFILKKYNYKKIVTMEYLYQNDKNLTNLEENIKIFKKYYG